MQTKQTLYALYRDFSYKVDGQVRRFYRLLRFFSSYGEIHEGTLEGHYLRYNAPINDDQMVFVSLEELLRFVEEISREQKAMQVYALSVDDFNIALEHSQHSEQIIGIFEKYGTKIDNTEYLNQKGLLSRIFR